MTTTLSRIELAGFRSIERMDIPLGRTTVLIGPNGAGKSNLLSFLQLVPRMRTQSLRISVGLAGGAKAVLHQGVQRYSEIGFRIEATTADGRDTAYAGTLGAVAGDHFRPEEVMVVEAPNGVSTFGRGDALEPRAGQGVR